MITVIAVVLTSQILLANSPADFIDRYKIALQHDVATANGLVEQVKARDRSICSGVVAKDMSSCLRQKLTSLQVHSSSEMVTLLEAPLAAARIDKEQKYSGEVVTALLADNLTLLLERVDMKAFHLSTMRADSPVDRVEVEGVRRDDETLLNEKWPQIIALITSKIEEVQKGGGTRAPASSQPWIKTKIADVTGRLKVLRAKTLSYSSRL